MPWASIFAYSGNERNIRITDAEGTELLGYLKTNEALDTSLVIVPNHTASGTLTVTLPTLAGTYQIWDVKRGTQVGATNRQFRADVEANKSAIFLVSRAESVIQKFVADQATINRSTEDFFLSDAGTIHFFVKTVWNQADFLNPDVVSFPRDGTEVRPTAAIVVGEGVSTAAIEFAERLRAFFYTWKNGSNRVVLPVYSLPQDANAIPAGTNLVLVGGPGTNTLSRTF